MHEESESEESDFDEEEMFAENDDDFLIEEKLVEQQVFKII